MLFYESQTYKEYKSEIYHSNGLAYQDNIVVDNILKKGYKLDIIGAVEDFNKHSEKDNSVLTADEYNSYKDQYWKFMEAEAFKKVYHLATPDIRNIVDKWTPAYFEMLKMKKLIDTMEAVFKGKGVVYDEIHHLFGYDIAMSSYIVSKSSNFTMDNYNFYKANKLPIKQLNDKDVNKHLSMLLQGKNNGYSSLLLYYAVYKYFFIQTSSITKAIFGLDRNITKIKDTTYVKKMWRSPIQSIGQTVMYGNFNTDKFDYIKVYGEQVKIYQPEDKSFMLKYKGLYFAVDLQGQSTRLLDFDKSQRSYNDKELLDLRRFQDFFWQDIVRVMQLFASNLSDYFDLLSKSKIPTEYLDIYQNINIYKTTSVQMSKIAGLMTQGEINSNSEKVANETDFVSKQFDKMLNLTDKADLLSNALQSNALIRSDLTNNVDNIEDIDELLIIVADNEKLLQETAEGLQSDLGSMQDENDRLVKYAKNLKSFKPSKSGNVYQAIAENKKMLSKAQGLKAKMEGGGSATGNNSLADMSSSSSRFCQSCTKSTKSKGLASRLSEVVGGFSMRGFSIPEIPSVPNVKDLISFDIPSVSSVPSGSSCSADLDDSSGFGDLIAGITSFIGSLQAIVDMIATVIQALIDVFSAIFCALLDVIKLLIKLIECLLSVVLAGVELVEKATKAVSDFISSIGDSEDSSEDGLLDKAQASIEEAFEETVGLVVSVVQNVVEGLVKSIEAFTPLDDVEDIFNNLLASIEEATNTEGVSNLLRGSSPSSIEDAVDGIVDEMMRKEYLANATLNSKKLQKLYNDLIASGTSEVDIADIMSGMSAKLEECNKPTVISDEKRADIKAKLLAKLRDKANPMDKAKDCLGLKGGVDFSFDFDFSLPSLSLPSFNMGC